MASFERTYQKATDDQIRNCIRWCQNTLQLRDWHIDLYLGKLKEDRDDEAYTCITPGNRFRNIAELWLDPEVCKRLDVNPYRTVCHEMLHVLVLGKCRLESDDDQDEYISYILEDMLYQNFCSQNKIKIMPFRKL